MQDENLKHFIRTNEIHQLIGPKKLIIFVYHY